MVILMIKIKVGLTKKKQLLGKIQLFINIVSF